MEAHNYRQEFVLAFFAILLCVVVGAIYWYVETVDRANVLETTERDVNDQLSSATEILSRAFEEGERQVRFLSGTPPIQGAARSIRTGIDPLDSTPYPIWLERLEKIAQSYMQNNPDILQVRLIGLANKGKELVRVSREEGHLQVVKKVYLQEKAGEKYFQQTEILNAGEILVSGIDLNREHGRISYPLMPTYRVSMPVYDERGVLFGMVVVNYDGKRLIERVRNNTNREVSVYLLNPRGDFVLHPSPQKEFLVELGKTSANTHETLQQDVYRSSAGLRRVIVEGQNLYVSQRQIWLSRPDEGRYLDLVVSIPEAHVEAAVFQKLAVTMVAVIAVLIIAVLAIIFFQRQLATRYAYSVAEAQFRAIVDGSQDAIISVDPNTEVTSWNKAANRLLGWGRMQAIGQPLLSLLKLDDPEQLESDLQDAIENSQSHTNRKIRVQVQDRYIDLDVSISPVLNKQGFDGVGLVLRDVSAEHRAAEEIRRLNESLESQVEERTADLEIARNQALQASDMKSAFLANMSHEIRTPMNGIFGMLNLLKRGQLDEEQARYLGMAENSVESLSSLINDILDLSKVEAGRLTLEAVEFDLLDVMSSQISSLSLRAQQRGLEVLFDFAGVEHAVVVGDPLRFKQILTNLMGNAIKFTQRGEILITARSFVGASGKVCVSYAVRDTGIGIAKNRIDLLFDAFSQADSSTTRKFGGTGLGLSITRHLVDQMGGSIKVDSEEGKGSTFTVNLELPCGTTQPVLEQHKTLIEGKRVLVLSKNLNLMASTRKLLRTWKANADTTNNLAEVLDRINQKSLDILVVDQDAFALSQNQSLLNVIFRPDVLDWLKVVVLSAQSASYDDFDLDGLDSHSVMKLIKPVSPMEFGRMLERFYGSSEEESNIEEREQLEQYLDQQLATFGKMQLLLVDDVLINREVILGLLHAFEFDIHQANNGEEALQQLKQNTIDVVLMDCQMPELDGFGATAKIREGATGQHNARVPIIAMTAGAMAGDRDACIAAGMNDYITKPIDSFEFKQKLLNWLQSGQETKTAIEVVTLEGLDSIPDLNFGAALARMGNNPKIYKKMVDMYIEDTPSKLRNLAEALEKEQLEAARHLGHALKGTSATIGAEKMQNICQQIELASADDNVELVKSMVAELKSVYPNVLKSLEKQDLG